MFEQWCVDNRIACEEYPASEAQFLSVHECVWFNMINWVSQCAV